MFRQTLCALIIVSGSLFASATDDQTYTQEQLYEAEKKEWEKHFPLDAASFPDFETWKQEEAELDKWAKDYWAEQERK